VKEHYSKIILLQEVRPLFNPSEEGCFYKRSCELCGKMFRTYLAINFLCKVCSHGHGAYKEMNEGDQLSLEKSTSSEMDNVIPFRRTKNKELENIDSIEEDLIVKKPYEFDLFMASPFLLGA